MKKTARKKATRKKTAKKPGKRSKRKKTRARSSPAAAYPSQRAFARALDIAPSTLADNVQRPDWPVSRRAPWNDKDLEAVKQWRGSLQVDRSGKGGAVDPELSKALHKATADRAQIRAERERLLFEKDQGSLINRTEAERALVGLTQMYTGILQELRDGLATKLDGDPRHNQAIIVDVIDDAVRRLLGERGVHLANLDEVADAKKRARGRPGVGG